MTTLMAKKYIVFMRIVNGAAFFCATYLAGMARGFELPILQLGNSVFLYSASYFVICIALAVSLFTLFINQRFISHLIRIASVFIVYYQIRWLYTLKSGLFDEVGPTMNWINETLPIDMFCVLMVTISLVFEAIWMWNTSFKSIVNTSK